MKIILQFSTIWLASVLPSSIWAQEFDAQKFIDSLASRNKAPFIAEVGSGEVHFDTAFDWEEYSRCLRLLKEMPRHTEELGPSLKDHFKDERYVTTVATSSGAKTNLNIGESCLLFVRDTLTTPCFLTIPRPLHRKIVVAQLTPEFLRPEEKIGLWLSARQGQPIHKLQIEICESVKLELRKPEMIRAIRANAADAESLIASIDKTIAEVSREKRSIPARVFSTLESLAPAKSSRNGNPKESDR